MDLFIGCIFKKVFQWLKKKKTPTQESNSRINESSIPGTDEKSTSEEWGEKSGEKWGAEWWGKWGENYACYS